jgi:hypothetical protein
MATPNGPQFKHWSENWEQNRHSVEWGPSDDPRKLDSGVREDLSNWSKSGPFTGKAEFPTTGLMHIDPTMAEPSKKWDPNPEIARKQKAPSKLPEDAPESHRVNTEHADFMHKSMEGTGVPSHATVYHFGAPPKDSRYASGSVSPTWPEEVRTGWRSKDPSINRGNLHIFLVPHQDILAASGSENEVFFRRGTQLNKKPRSRTQQRNIEAKEVN